MISLRTDTIARFSSELASAETIASIRLIEAQAASAYWSSWRNLPVNFPRKDLCRTPQHWLTFGTRISPLTGSPRSAINPANAILSYLYAILESEARLAGISLGLDPLVGILHADQQARDNLVYDLVEPVRPQVDLRREWFLELATGQCRLMNSLVSRLSETAPIWARLVAPIAESVTQALWRSGKKASNNEESIPTRLTQRRRSEGRGNQFVVKATRVLQRERICELCGAEHSKGRYCKSCGIELAREHMANVALIGHSTPKTPAAKARISNRLSNHAVANTWWSPSSLPPWLNQEFYVEKIQPKLRTLKVREIAQAMQVSQPYAAFIRSGRRRAHPRHWQELARLAGVFADTEPEPGPQNKANQ